jgi:DNA-binding winged helix-turn-helix (wHTH) protein
MVFRFYAFKLDEQRRELSVGGRELRLQPRVFDVLTYLLRHRDRVVSKDELLQVLWPGMVVVDGALQRVMSLARTALREGRAEGAIRTHARRGYRFCADVEESDEVRRDPAGAAEALAAGQWETAEAVFRSVDAVAGLSADGLEQWAQVLQYTGRGNLAIAPLERAVAAHAMAGARGNAARSALCLAQIEFEQRNFAVAEGWLQRASRLLDGQDDTREAGVLAWLASRMALATGDNATALDRAEQAYALGIRLRDIGIETLGLLYRGHALMARGEMRCGVALHDEAGATILSGQAEPWLGGNIYCGIIWACRNRADWQRAAQWTERFSSWCRDTAVCTAPRS